MKKWQILTLGLLVASIGAVAWSIVHRPEPSLTDESAAERAGSMRAAYTPTAGSGNASNKTGDDALMAEAKKFFGGLGAAFESKEIETMKRYISGDGMLNYAERSGMLDLSSFNTLEQMNFKRRFLRGMIDGLGSTGSNTDYSQARVVRLEQIREGELLAYIRAHNTWLETETKERWWLLKNRKGEWQAYDWEDLDVGMRTSTLIGAIANPGPKQPWFGEMMKFLQVAQSVNSSNDEADWSEMQEPAEALLKHKLPVVIESLARGVLATVLLTEGDPDAALKQIDRLVEMNGEEPSDIYVRAKCYSEQGDLEKAIAEFERYTEVLGWDAEVHENVADCYYQLGDRAKSLEHAEKGLEHYPGSMGCLASLVVSLPADRHGEIAGLVTKFENREVAYEWIIDHTIDVENQGVYAFVFAKLKSEFPGSDLIQYYEENGLGPDGEEPVEEED